jgi:hypothetical protein
MNFILAGTYLRIAQHLASNLFSLIFLSEYFTETIFPHLQRFLWLMVRLGAVAGTEVSWLIV